MATTTTLQTIQFKRGTTAKLAAWTVIPKAGEPIFDTELNKLKIGDGIHLYADLPYIGGSDTMEQIVFANHYEFPAIGEEGKLYIATDEKNSYIWDSESTAYVILSVDQREIHGGGADSF